MRRMPGRTRRQLPVLIILTLALVACQASVDTPAQVATPPAALAETPSAAPSTTGAATAPGALYAPETLTTTQDEPAPGVTSPRVTAPAAVATGQATEAPLAPTEPPAAQKATLEVQEYDVARGSHPHDVAPAADGGVWYTAQAAGALGWLDPATGESEEISLGAGSAPHGVIVGQDGSAWITDSGLNAIVRVDAKSREITRFDLPADRRGANLNTAVFDPAGKLWFTGQSGIYGVLDPASGDMQVYDAPKGRGPYGITATPDGRVYYASLAGSYLGEVDPATGESTVLEPPTAGQGARRAWADSGGRVWVSEWNAGKLAVYDPASGAWKEWSLPGNGARAYSVYVDWQDQIWLSDFGNNTLVRFDPAKELFESVALPSPNASVRQMHGREGEVWGAESAVDKLVVVRVR